MFRFQDRSSFLPDSADQERNSCAGRYDLASDVKASVVSVSKRNCRWIPRQCVTLLKRHKSSPKIRFASLTAVVLAVLFEQSIACTSLGAQEGQPFSAIQIVNKMVQAESAAWRSRQHFLYRNEERSSRTDGRLWDEIVVETSDGSMQRLISEDGKPLSDSQEKAEEERITYLGNHPVESRRKTRRRKEDEARMPELLREIPNIFLQILRETYC
jgi:hypothetical protein